MPDRPDLPDLTQLFIHVDLEADRARTNLLREAIGTARDTFKITVHALDLHWDLNAASLRLLLYVTDGATHRASYLMFARDGSTTFVVRDHDRPHLIFDLVTMPVPGPAELVRLLRAEIRA